MKLISGLAAVALAATALASPASAATGVPSPAPARGGDATKRAEYDRTRSMFGGGGGVIVRDDRGRHVRREGCDCRG